MALHTFETLPNRLRATKDGVAFLDTDQYPVQFFPTDKAITLSSKVVTFPDFVKNDSYAYARGLIGSSIYTGCASYITITAQEWGPVISGYPTPTHTLADEVVGTVPGDTDVLLVQANMTRTTTPSQILGRTIPTLFKEGQSVSYFGGAIPLELFAPISRMMSFVLATSLNGDGTRNVLLRRHQSVQYREYTYFRSDNNPDLSGWTHGGGIGYTGHIVSQRDSRGPVWDPSANNSKRGGGGGCLLSDNTNYSSVFTGNFVITPGKFDITPENAISGLGFAYNGVVARTSGNASSLTATNSPIGFAPEAGHTRHVLITVPAYSTLDTGGTFSVGSATITPAGGSAIAMTRIAHQEHYQDNGGGNGDTNAAVAIFIAEVPTGTTATITASFAGGNFDSALISSYSLYDLVSATPDAIIQSKVGNLGSATLATVAGGIAIAQNMNGQERLFTGIGNVWVDIAGTYGTTRYPTCRAFQNTDGSTLTIQNGANFEPRNNTSPWCAVSLH